MTEGYVKKPGLLRSAFKRLFSARKSDWERFDGIFDAFWLGRRVKSRSVTMGSAKAANNPSLKSFANNPPYPPAGGDTPTDQVPSSAGSHDQACLGEYDADGARCLCVRRRRQSNRDNQEQQDSSHGIFAHRDSLSPPIKDEAH